MYFSFLLLILSCKNEPMLSLEDKEIDINTIRTDFQKKTGYQQNDSSFVNSSFKSVIDWNTFYEIGKDTLYVKVKVLDRLEILVSDSTRILLNDNVWIRGVKKGKTWKYSVLTFIPSSKTSQYNGIIISKSLHNGAQNISFYESNIKVPKALMKKAGKAPSMPTDCVKAYVNGYLNEISCPGGGSDDGNDNDPTYPGDPRDYQNFPPSGGGGSGGTGGEGTVPTYTEVPSETNIKAQIKDKPFALIPNIPCDIIKKWLATAKFTVDQTTESKLRSIEEIIKPGSHNSYLTNVQNINNAYSTVVNMDYFPINVSTLPIVNGKRLTPEQFIGHIRKNINSFIDTDYSEFKPYVYSGVNETNLWNSADPKNAVVAIDIKGPDNGSVIVSQYNSTGWTFTTIYEPMFGQHPVSGNRDFGYVKNSNGSYTFYTRGVDRLTGLDGNTFQKTTEFFSGEGYPFKQADALWTSFQNIVANFVNKNGGNAGVANQEIHRPDWSLVKDVIDGKKPLSSLSTDCK